MASGFPAGAYCSKASQTPMSFCAASSVSTCTRTREGMSSIVLLGFLVSSGEVEKSKVGLKLTRVTVYCGRLALFDGASQRS